MQMDGLILSHFNRKTNQKFWTISNLKFRMFKKRMFEKHIGVFVMDVECY